MKKSKVNLPLHNEKETRELLDKHAGSAGLTTFALLLLAATVILGLIV